MVTLAGVEMIGKLETFTFIELIWAKSVNITTSTVYSHINNGYAEIAFFGRKMLGNGNVYVYISM